MTAEWEIEEDYTDIEYYRYSIVVEEELVNLKNLAQDRFITVEGTFPREEKYYTKTANTNTNLEENKIYYFVIEAVNTVGNSSGYIVSSDVTIDSNPPVINEITLANLITTETTNYLNDIKNLEVTVDISDNEGSGLNSIEYALVENLFSTDNYSWYTDLEELKLAENIQDGHTYYLMVKATDNLNQANIAHSGSVVIDQSAPDIKKLIAGSELEINNTTDPYRNRPNIPIPLSFVIDEQTEITSISYSIGTNPGDTSITRETPV